MQILLRRPTILLYPLGLGLGLLLLAGAPWRLAPDGTRRHEWQITWMTSSNTVLVTEHPTAGKVVQQFWSNTAYPRRDWGAENIRYHWFGAPTFRTPPEADGSYCVGKLVK